MKRATKYYDVAASGSLTPNTTVTLAYDDRHRRRIKMTTDGGMPFLLDLDQATYLHEGGVLELDDGEAILVVAAREEVLDVSFDSPEQAVKVAWHIGNRHTPVQVLDAGGLRLRYDHVLQHMIEGLGAHCQKKTAPFAPEPGAYQSGGGSSPHAHH